jgi:hypothetical protein
VKKQVSLAIAYTVGEKMMLHSARKWIKHSKTAWALVNDMSESQLLTLIKEKNYPAISFWLRHRNDNYKNKLEITTKEESEALTPSQAKIVRNALKARRYHQE